jgi:hypothetical protein
MKVLDLFSGLSGWGGPFREAGHEVFAIDLDLSSTLMPTSTSGTWPLSWTCCGGSRT